MQYHPPSAYRNKHQENLRLKTLYSITKIHRHCPKQRSTTKKHSTISNPRTKISGRKQTKTTGTLQPAKHRSKIEKSPPKLLKSAEKIHQDLRTGNSLHIALHKGIKSPTTQLTNVKNRPNPNDHIHSLPRDTWQDRSVGEIRRLTSFFFNLSTSVY